MFKKKPEPQAHILLVVGLLAFTTGILLICLIITDGSEYIIYKDAPQTVAQVTSKKVTEGYRSGKTYYIFYTYQLPTESGTQQVYKASDTVDSLDYDQLNIGSTVTIDYLYSHPNRSRLAQGNLSKKGLQQLLFFSPMLIIGGLLLAFFFHKPIIPRQPLRPFLPLHPDFGKPLQRKKSPYDTEKNKKKRVWHVNPPKDDSYFS